MVDYNRFPDYVSLQVFIKLPDGLIRYVTSSILDIPAQGRDQVVSERGLVRLGLIYNSNIASSN